MFRVFLRSVVTAMTVVAFVAGCGGGSSGGASQVGSVSVPAGGTQTATPTPTPSSLLFTVQFEPAAISQLPTGVASYQIAIIDDKNSVVRTFTVTLGQASTITGLEDGTYLVRLLALNATGDTLGYFDRLLSFNGQDLQELLPGLRMDSSPPQPDYPSSPPQPSFFLFTGAPQAIHGITIFSLDAQLFNNHGYPVLSGLNNVSLTSSSVDFETVPPVQSADSNGKVHFANLCLVDGQMAQTTFQVVAPGLATSHWFCQVTPAPPFYRAASRASLTQTNQETNFHCFNPSLSFDANLVVFETEADNLIADDTNNVRDVLLKNRTDGSLQRVSVSSSGEQGNGPSGNAVLSADGHFVAFNSEADNLVTGDTNGATDVFLRDLQTGETVLVSLGVGGGPSNGPSYRPSISADGSFICFQSAASNLVASDTNGFSDIFLYERATQTVERVSVSETGVEGLENSSSPKISSDGRFIAFESRADNLVPGDSGSSDIFVYDRVSGTLELVSRNSMGVQGDLNSFRPSISGDGRHVAFQSYARNLVASDVNGKADIFVRDGLLGTTERVSLTESGDESNDDSDYPFISADGRFVAFQSKANNLGFFDIYFAPDDYIFDRKTSTLERVSRYYTGGFTGGTTLAPVISGNGLFVSFPITDPILPDDKFGVHDIYLLPNPFKRAFGLSYPEFPSPFGTFLELLSLSSAGTRGNGSTTFDISYSGDGRLVAFASQATNFDPQDTDPIQDVYLRDRTNRTTEFIPVTTAPANPPDASGRPSMSSDGRFLAFQTDRPLLPIDTNNRADFYVRDLTTGTVKLLFDGPPPIYNATNGVVLSGDGSKALVSTALALDPNDTNGRYDAYFLDLDNNTSERISANSTGGQLTDDIRAIRMTRDARFCLWLTDEALTPGDANGREDYFLADRNGSGIELLTKFPDGSPLNVDALGAAISDDGRFFAFTTRQGVYLLDRNSQVVKLIGDPGATSFNVFMSGDGRYIAFSSDDNTLVTNDGNLGEDVFVYDRINDSLTLVSLDDQGGPVDSNAVCVGITQDGQEVFFLCNSRTLLTPGDPYILDLFVTKRQR